MEKIRMLLHFIKWKLGLDFTDQARREIATQERDAAEKAVRNLQRGGANH